MFTGHVVDGLQDRTPETKKCFDFFTALFFEIFSKFSFLSFLMHLSYLSSLSTFSGKFISFKVFA